MMLPVGPEMVLSYFIFSLKTKKQDLCLYVCLSLPKDLANFWTNIVFLYTEASYMSWDGFRLFYFYSLY